MYSQMNTYTSRRGSMSKETSPEAAKAASKVLRDPSSTKAEKTAAASALAQVEPKKKK